MATNITIIEQTNRGAIQDATKDATRNPTRDATEAATHATSSAPARRVPGWLWFIALWCFGVGAAMSLGFAFKILMNATLFAVR